MNPNPMPLSGGDYIETEAGLVRVEALTAPVSEPPRASDAASAAPLPESDGRAEIASPREKSSRRSAD